MNIIQFARKVGVSTATVSRAFHEPAKVRAKTLERVLAEARKLRYYPSPIGRALVRGCYDALGLVWPLEVEGADAVFAHRVLAELVEALVEHDQELLLCPVDRERPQTLLHAERSIPRSKCDAWLMMYPRRNDRLVEVLRQTGRPVVALMGQVRGEKGWKSVVLDQEEWIADALRRLRAGGGRRAAFVGARPGEPDHEERVRQFRRLAPRLFDRTAVYGGDWPVHLDPLTAWLVKETPNAILAVDDRVALTVLGACRRAKRRVPSEVQVIGFDNTPESAHTTPRLATYEQPLTEMVGAAVELALGRSPLRSVFHARFVSGGTLRSSAG
jgi:DNA-binding LacI/PurR family transcriptional regulator